MTILDAELSYGFSPFAWLPRLKIITTSAIAIRGRKFANAPIWQVSPHVAIFDFSGNFRDRICACVCVWGFNNEPRMRNIGSKSPKAQK